MSESGKPEDAEKPQQPDHWAELASELGAAPPEPPGPESADVPADEGPSAEPFEEADSGRGPEAPGAAQVRPEVSKPFRPPREPRLPTDWDLLAEELGIVEPSSVQPAARPSVVEPSEPSVAPEGGLAKPDQGPESAGAHPETVFADDEAAAARFEEAVDLFDDTAEPEPAEMEFGAPDVATDAGPEAPAEVDDARAAASTAEAAPGKRGKRRRRRPGRKKKGPATSATAQGEPQQEEEAAAAAGASEAAKSPAPPASRPAPEHPADAPASSQAAAKSGKVSHRGIPTWEQAVGLIVTKNLEARPKPKRTNGPSRGRGKKR